MLLVVTAVQREADAIKGIDGIEVIVGGIGRTNAAAATTQALVAQPAVYRGVINAGVAGVLPSSSLPIGDVACASRSIYMEEGLITPEGFVDIQAMGLSLGVPEGSVLLPDLGLLQAAEKVMPSVDIATVATCSGTDDAARAVEERTGAQLEAMEGAAVLHAAGRLGIPALEVRSVSNTTGHRDHQRWDLDAALGSLGHTMSDLCAALS